jgi:hypothetical protein
MGSRTGDSMRGGGNGASLSRPKGGPGVWDAQARLPSPRFRLTAEFSWRTVEIQRSTRGWMVAIHVVIGARGAGLHLLWRAYFRLISRLSIPYWSKLTLAIGGPAVVGGGIAVGRSVRQPSRTEPLEVLLGPPGTGPSEPDGDAVVADAQPIPPPPGPHHEEPPQHIITVAPPQPKPPRRIRLDARDPWRLARLGRRREP